MYFLVTEYDFECGAEGGRAGGAGRQVIPYEYDGPQPCSGPGYTFAPGRGENRRSRGYLKNVFVFCILAPQAILAEDGVGVGGGLGGGGLGQ